MSDFCCTVFFIMTVSHWSSLCSASKNSIEADEPTWPKPSHPQHCLTTLTAQRDTSNPHHDLCITAMTNARMKLWKQERKRLSQHYTTLFKQALLLRGQCPFFEPPCHSGKSSQGVLTVAGNVAITVALRMSLMVAVPIHGAVQVGEGWNSGHLTRTKEALVPFHSEKIK